MWALSPFQTLAWLPLALLGLDGFYGLRLGGEGVADDGGSKDANVRDGTVIPVGGCLLNLVYHVEALSDFAEYGVLAVEMGRATNGLVGLYHLWRKLHLSVGGRVQPLLYEG